MQVAVLGAGSWGTALALVLAQNGHSVPLWGHRAEHIAQLQTTGQNRRYLPGISLPKAIRPTSRLDEALNGTTQLIVAVPSHAFRATLTQIAALKPSLEGLTWATKGLELETGCLLHQVVESIFGSVTPAAVLSGPSFAGEVARGQPTAVTVASTCAAHTHRLVSLFHTAHFRPYSHSDVVGVELGGAIKNVLAIAAGLADGLGFGANARAALITRGLREMIRLGTDLGGRADTLMGLSGVGDLILTATDNQSRNRRFGQGLGQGLDRDQIIATIGQEIEGIPTARILWQLAINRGIDMPITEQVFKILYEGLPPREAVGNLLLRDPKPESDLDA
jgi:glycerol-3-phosphate dehydrogenase (NAD(P)+)